MFAEALPKALALLGTGVVRGTLGEAPSHTAV